MVKWLVPLDAEVAFDELVVAISTEKIDVELGAPVAGTLSAIEVHDGEWVAIGATLGIVTPR